MTNQFSVGNNLLNFSSCDNRSDWINFQRDASGLHLLFAAKKANDYAIRQDADVEVFYLGSNSFDQVITENMTYHFLCQWDDCGSIAEDKTTPGVISKTPEDYLGPAPDEDNWFFTPQDQGYCLEFSSSNELKIVASQSGGKVWSNAVEVIRKDASRIISKRLYLTNLSLRSRLNFKLTKPGTNQEQNVFYDLRLSPIRPLILVHGIRSSPTSASDHRSSFGKLAKLAFRYADLPPALVFDFPWDSSKNSIYSYCGKKTESKTLFGYSFQKCGDWKLKPVFFGHSMGGLLILEQLKNKDFKNFTASLVFGGTPFCGSDLANYRYLKKSGKALHKLGNALNKVRTTEKNLLLLIRGASWIWQRLQEAPSDIRSVFIVGDQKDTYPVGKGDGTVNLSSASLYNTLNWPSEDHLNVDLDHGGITEINIPPTGAHALILNKIKALLEH